MKKKFMSLMLVMAMVLSLAACGAKKEEAPASDAPASTPAAESGSAFKLGGTGPLTGGAAIYGTAAKNGATIAVDEINAMGGIQFDLKYEDDTHDAEKAVNAYNALKDWDMQISLGSVTSKPCEATAAETYADRIFALTPSASSTAVTEGKDNMFQMCFMDPNQGSASAQYIADKALATKVAVIWKNDDVYSKGIHDTFTAKANELGLEIVSDTTFADGNDTDFSVQLSGAQTNGADLVFLPMYYQPASLIFAQASSMNYAPKWFGVDGMDGILTMEGFDPALAEGVMLLTPFNADSTDERTASFVKAYQERFNEVPNQFAADAYDCVYAYKQALEAAGCTPDMSASDLCDKMVEQFTSMSFDGLTGEGMTWDASGAVSKSPKGMVIENGAYVGLD
ncbi:ABC transporter substrate-binding protein [Oscillibacter sp.]|uniref:ABC transporter substrate-binding protein n=1 Tax=Oscillibacter sp. TaxID=1945593 RepID=UPI002634BCD4|nr:ABC transporter substrate-binding protein [Oscillibacter sp.]MDD3347091.1 ABC transporter substrate-binding protein [Oscillibacter sp.]